MRKRFVQSFKIRFSVRVRSFDSLPEKEFLEKIGKSVRLTRYSHSGKLEMSSKLSAMEQKSGKNPEE